MKTLLYQNLDAQKIPNFTKIKAQLEAGDYQSADVRKVGKNLFRARLDRTNRLLFSFARHNQQSYILILEFIPNHNYEKSRFLARGVQIDETALPIADADSSKESEKLVYVNEAHNTFNVLDKIIFFDDNQHETYNLKPPFIIIGSAGSGKTVLTLEKLKQAEGDVLYVTRSPYLVDKSSESYYGLNYENEDQEASFLSYAEFLESIRVPQTREVGFTDFESWFARHSRAAGFKDAYQLYEEFNGVITGTGSAAYLSREGYVSLGVRQSIYPVEVRDRVYDLFQKYLQFLQDSGFHDINIISYEYQALVKPEWDFIIIDEVQDFTNVQLELIFRGLKNAREFVLSGDSNQIVHPNFFSWSGLKSHLYEKTSQTTSTDFESPADLIRILSTNYRNSRQVTEMANRILRLKHARFGSVDRESNHLVTSNSLDDGNVILLSDVPEVTNELDGKTHGSTRHAVIVLNPEDKKIAQEKFRTPLIFSVQEIKGLEYENIVLYGFVSEDEKRFREIAKDVDPEQVRSGELKYARAKDKTDKSLEIYKFHINALYVAVTRAIRTIYLVEPKPNQPIYNLMDIQLFSGEFQIENQKSSLAEWNQEAQKLERQGKATQAEDIRKRILGVQPVPWNPVDRVVLNEISNRIYTHDADRKSMLYLYEYALLSCDYARLNLLKFNHFKPARNNFDIGIKKLIDNHYGAYSFKNARGIERLVGQYGVDHRDRFNFTPLMLATRFGSENGVQMLTQMNAKLDLVNCAGLTAYQIMLQQARIDKTYAEKTTTRICAKICPKDVSVMVGGRLTKLDSHKAEFLFFNLFMAIFNIDTQQELNVHRNKLGITAAQLENVLESFPDSIVPNFRKQRRYISSVLARNEMNRDTSNNRRIFKRLTRGYYVLNPELSVKVEQKWVRIYDLLEPESLFNHDFVEITDAFYFSNQFGRLEELTAKIQKFLENELLDNKQTLKEWASLLRK